MKYGTQIVPYSILDGRELSWIRQVSLIKPHRGQWIQMSIKDLHIVKKNILDMICKRTKLHIRQGFLLDLG